MKSGQRFARIDIFRGIGVLLVVLGHAIQRHLPGYSTNVIWRLIYSFHMPLFFVLSAALLNGKLEDGADESLGRALRERFFSLVVPFLLGIPLLFAASYLPVSGLRPFIDFSGGLSGFAVRTIENPANGLWFLWILFLLQASTLIAHQFFGDKDLLVLLAVWAVLVMLPALPFGLVLVRWYALPYAAGLALARTARFAKDAPVALSTVAFAGFAFSAVSFVALKIQSPVDPMLVFTWSSLGHYALKFVWAMAGIALVWTIACQFEDAGRTLRVTILGSLSLEVYVTHLLFLGLPLHSNGWSAVAISAVLATFCSLSLVLLLYRWAGRPASLMFGRRRTPTIQLSTAEITGR